MEIYNIKNLSFSYPNSAQPAISDICLDICEGEFVTVCGLSGCGKTTLLRLLKPTAAPYGNLCGEILYKGTTVNEMPESVECGEIGFVFQNPDTQIVTDKVWHELSFGAENLGLSKTEIRTRVAETAAFFGIDDWYHKKICELSGGQKQLLNLASVMVMHPAVLILDEPTAMLDPIAAEEFLNTVSKTNKELGVTVIISEHKTDKVFSLSSRVIVMGNGRIIADGTPGAAAKRLYETADCMTEALPASMRICKGLGGDVFPTTVCDAQKWLTEYAMNHNSKPLIKTEQKRNEKSALKARDLWFRYERNQPDILRGMSIDVKEGEFYAIVGGNGVGKSTAMWVLANVLPAYRGKISVSDKVYMLPQDAKSLFTKDTLFDDLFGNAANSDSDDVREICRLCDITELTDRHPYDLSGGELQRAALAKILLKNPRIILLDEPTKGMDAHFKKHFADILLSLRKRKTTIVMVSHDIEFCAEYADRCALMFDGKIVSEGRAKEFFENNYFYTTDAVRISRNIADGCVTVNDVLAAFSCDCKGSGAEKTDETDKNKTDEVVKKCLNRQKDKKKKSYKKEAAGVLCRTMVGVTVFIIFRNLINPMMPTGNTGFDYVLLRVTKILFAALIMTFILPKKFRGKKQIYKLDENVDLDELKGSRKSDILLFVLYLLIVPMTVLLGKFCFGGQYYFTSLLIIAETIIPFAMHFEKRKPDAREITLMGVICASAAIGRAAFYALPQFKPMLAVIISGGVAMGPSRGFLIGAVSAFVSNFFFSQGAWTPWQMLACALVGFFAGALRKRRFMKNSIGLCIFGGLMAFFVYGGIVNIGSVFMMNAELSAGYIAAIFAQAIPFDAVHAAATVFFLWFTGIPFIKKTQRIINKFGIGKK